MRIFVCFLVFQTTCFLRNFSKSKIMSPKMTSPRHTRTKTRRSEAAAVAAVARRVTEETEEGNDESQLTMQERSVTQN